MWTRREVLTLAGLVPVAAANAAAAAAQAAKRSKDQTVVLEISGMT